MKRITDWVHEGLRQHLRPGAWALDGTLGNGHDAELLLAAVGERGRVFAFDVQPGAVDRARERFPAPPVFEAFLVGHERLDRCLPEVARQRLSAAVFNLGYLPGADHRLSTQGPSTTKALALALEWLQPAGVLACTCYPGTPEGAAEARQVLAWTATLEGSACHVTRIESLGTRDPGPFALWMEKR